MLLQNDCILHVKNVELYKNWKTVIDKERGRIDITMFHMMVYYRRRKLLNVKF